MKLILPLLMLTSLMGQSLAPELIPAPSLRADSPISDGGFLDTSPRAFSDDFTAAIEVFQATWNTHGEPERWVKSGARLQYDHEAADDNTEAFVTYLQGTVSADQWAIVEIDSRNLSSHESGPVFRRQADGQQLESRCEIVAEGTNCRFVQMSDRDTIAATSASVACLGVDDDLFMVSSISGDLDGVYEWAIWGQEASAVTQTPGVDPVTTWGDPDCCITEAPGHNMGATNCGFKTNWTANPKGSGIGFMVIGTGSNLAVVNFQSWEGGDL